LYPVAGGEGLLGVDNDQLAPIAAQVPDKLARVVKRASGN